jgi:hypothetical protein
MGNFYEGSDRKNGKTKPPCSVHSHLASGGERFSKTSNPSCPDSKKKTPNRDEERLSNMGFRIVSKVAVVCDINVKCFSTSHTSNFLKY